MLTWVAALLWAGPASAQVLTGSWELLAPGTAVDLTAEGDLDWGHWGVYSPLTYHHKYGLAQQIMATPVVDLEYNGPWPLEGDTMFGWTDGIPTLVVPQTRAGAYVFGVGNGLRLSCPADVTLKTLKFYMGATKARLHLSAVLSGEDVPAYTNASYANPGLGSNAVFTIQFQASSPGQTLTVLCTLDAELAPGGTISWQAVTLTGARLPPTAGLVAPAPGAVLAAPAVVPLTAVATNGTAPIANLEILSNGISVAQSHDIPLSMVLTNLSTNTYRFSARATDAHGVSYTSPPVAVFVTAGGGTLAGGFSGPPSHVNLRAEGTVDWVHWGHVSATSLNRRAEGAPVIPDVTVIGKPNDLNQYGDNFTGFTWTHGTPTEAATNTTSGIFMVGLGNGFQLAVPATPSVRRLKVYAGLYGAHGTFEAWLSDWSGPPFTDTTFGHAYNAYRVYTIDFASPSASAQLMVRWTAASLYDALYGNVTWQAATLADVPTLECVPDRIVECGAPWDFLPPRAVGFCDGGEATVTVLGTVTNFHCGPTFSATRTWQATDTCGHTAMCSQTVTVADTTTPVLACVSNRTVVLGTQWDFAPPKPLDACSGTNVTVTILETVTNATPTGLAATRTWQASDACGHATLCSQTVLMTDPQRPMMHLIERLSADAFGFSFNTQPGLNYAVLGSDTIAPADWRVLTNLSGDGLEAAITDRRGTNGQRFYRIRLE